MHSGDYYAIVISGRVRHYLGSEDECQVHQRIDLVEKGNAVHQDQCVAPEDCLLGIFSPNGFDVEFAEEKPSAPKEQ
jgi:quercetin dioxygenase-like cupin family protein